MENLAYIDEFNEIKTELIDGEIVMMSPKPRLEHGTVVTNISAEFRLNLKGKTCRAYCDGVDVFIDEKNIFVPDVMIVCNPTIRKKDGIHGAPDLVVEVLSPATAHNDRWKKKYTYGKAGVKEYWLVDQLKCIIEVYLNNNGEFILDKLYTMQDTEIKVSVCDKFIVKIAAIFDYADLYL